jgi:hypothetical protein
MKGKAIEKCTEKIRYDKILKKNLLTQVYLL